MSLLFGMGSWFRPLRGPHGARRRMLAGMSPRSVVIAALVCLVVTGCADALSTQTITHPIPVPSQTALTGTALKSALLPLSDFPAGYEVDTGESSDTGPALLSGSSSPTAAHQTCQQRTQTMMTPSAGVTASVFEILYDAAIHPSTYHQRRYGESVFQFASAHGSTGYFDSVRSTFSHCSSVTVKNGAITAVIKQTVSPASPVAGHEALLVRQRSTVNGVNADSLMLFTIAGKDVYGVGTTVFGVRLTARPSSLAGLMTKLIARVRAVECALACP